MAAARSRRYLDHGRAGENPPGRAISGLSRVVHAAGLELAIEWTPASTDPGAFQEIPAYAMSGALLLDLLSGPQLPV